MARLTGTHIDDRAAFAVRLRQTRLAKGLRQVDLSFPGCSVGYVARLEAGHRVPSLQVIRELARRLEVDEQWLARGEDQGPLGAEQQSLLDARIAVGFDELDEAEHRFEALLRSDGPNIRSQARLGLGQIALRRGDPGLAIDLLAEGAKAEDADAAAVEALGRAYALQGETEEAVALLRGRWQRAVDHEDRFEQLRFGVLLANALVDIAQFAEASAVLAGLIEQADGADPLTVARVHWSQSRLHALRQNTDAAIRHGRQALALLDFTEHTYQRARLHQLLAFVELDAGNAEEALRLARLGRELLGADATADDTAAFRLEEARALAMLGQVDEAASIAMETAGAAGSVHPLDIGRSFSELAGAIHTSGDPHRAAEVYELAIESLEREPNRYLAGAYAAYGEVLEELGRSDEAMAVYRKHVRLHAELEERGRAKPATT
jgi:tetratricopeptide (TPR) repeat protein